MADGKTSGLPPLEDMTHPEGIPALPAAQNRLLTLDNNLMATIAVGLLVPFLLSLLISKSKKKDKVRAVTCEVGGEPGLTKRNQRFLSLVETPWEGADTLAVLFEQACHQYAGNKFLGTRKLIKKETETASDGRQFEKVTFGEYIWLNYGEALSRVQNLSSGLMALGHKKGDRIAIFAETRADWLLALQACFRQNLQVVTIYASLGEEALVHSLRQTEVTTVICDRKQLKKLLTISDQCETVKHAVYMEDIGDDSQPSPTGSSTNWAIESFSNVEKLGQQSPVPPNLPKSGDVAVIMYTSGSTGMPKGVVMSHANIVATVAGVSTLIPNLSKNDVYLAYLPLAHVLELLAEVTMIAAGASIGYGSPLTLTDTSNKIKHGTKGDTSELRPTLMSAVPAILDRIREGVMKKVDGTGTLVKTLFHIAYKRRVMAIEGSWFGAWGIEKMLWDALIFKKIKLVLGGRVRGMLSGGAPLSRDTQRFINVCFGAPIGQGYGLTETCAGATFSEWDDKSVGRVGPPVPSSYIKLINWEEGNYKVTDNPPRGEIVVGGPSVTLGYFKNQEKTDEVFKVDERDLRWFYTGDIGQFHEDGCIEIIDRKKDIVKLQAGEYVSLGKVEAVLAVSSYVDNLMLYADPFHSYTVAIVVANQDPLEAWAKKSGVDYSDFTDLCSKPQACKEVLSSLNQAGKHGKLERFEIPTKVKLLSEPWTPDSGLVTAAMKLKREAVRKAFADDLKALYS